MALSNATSLALGGMGLGILGGVFGAIGQQQQRVNQARQQNKNAMNSWIQNNLQTALNNGSQLFQAAQNTRNQRISNTQIFKNAYLFQEESLDALAEQESFTQNQLSTNYQAARGAVDAQLAASNVRGGTAKALKLSQSLNFLKNATQADDNFNRTRNNIKRQTENMLSKRTSNVFMANMQTPNAMPEQQLVASGTMPIIGGILSGAASGFGPLVQSQLG